jgi:26S proteasome regulatory subunit T2
LEQAMENSTLATFLRVVGSELIQKYLGDGPSWCENSFVLLMSFPHPLSLSTKLMPLGQKGRFSFYTTLDRTIQFFLHMYTSNSSNLRDVL